MVAIAESISNFKSRGSPQLRRHRVCSAENPRFCSFSRLIVDRCSLTVDDGQDPAGYPGAAAHPRPGASAGFRGADAEHNCGELRSPPLNPGAAAHCRGVGTGFRGADEERKCIEHRSLPLNPGAAAHCRGVGTGFRGADAEHNCGEHCSPPLNINGANTYQFVMSNPVGNVDPTGLSLVTAPPPVAPPFVEPWIMPTGPQGPGWEPFNAPEFFPGPSPEPGLTPVPEGAGSFLDFINPWAAVLTPLFDTTPAGGNGDTIQAPWPYNLPGNQEPKTGPQVQTSPDGGARRRRPRCPAPPRGRQGRHRRRAGPPPAPGGSGPGRRRWHP